MSIELPEAWDDLFEEKLTDGIESWLEDNASHVLLGEVMRQSRGHINPMMAYCIIRNWLMLMEKQNV